MRAAQPDELRENAFPVITARVSEAELRQWFPVAFQEIADPWATPEPSKGALIKLDRGEYVVLYWGYESKELSVRIPSATDASSVVASLFHEVPLPRSRVLWRRPDVRLPRHIAAKSVSAAPPKGAVVGKCHRKSPPRK